MKLTNNNKEVAVLEFKPSGSWESNWRAVKVKAFIQAGANHLRLETMGESAPSIDQVQFE